MDQETSNGFGDTGGATPSLIDEELLRKWGLEEFVSGGFARVLGDGDAPNRSRLASH
jgi:hypothetical protein